MPSGKALLDAVTVAATSKHESLKGLVYATLSSRGTTPTRFDVEDILSTAYLDAARRIARDPLKVESPVGWFRRFVFNTCLRFLRESSKHRSTAETLEELEEDGSLHLEVAAWSPERQILARELLQSLPQDEARLLLEKFLLGHSTREIAAELGSNSAAIRQRVHRSLKRLHERVNQE